MINLAKHLQVTHEILRGWHRSRKTCTACVSNSHSAHSCSLTALQRKMIKVILDEEPEDEGDEGEGEEEESAAPPRKRVRKVQRRKSAASSDDDSEGERSHLVEESDEGEEEMEEEESAASPAALGKCKAPAAPVKRPWRLRELPPTELERLKFSELAAGDLLHGPQLFGCKRLAECGRSYLSLFLRGDGDRNLTKREMEAAMSTRCDEKEDEKEKQAGPPIRLIDDQPCTLGLVLSVSREECAMLWLDCEANLRDQANPRYRASTSTDPPSVRTTSLARNDQQLLLLRKVGALGELGGTPKDQKQKGRLLSFVKARLADPRFEKKQPDFTEEEVTALVSQGVEEVAGGRKRRQAETSFTPAQPGHTRMVGGMPLASAPIADDEPHSAKKKKKQQLTPNSKRAGKRKAAEAAEASAVAEGAMYADGSVDDDNYVSSAGPRVRGSSKAAGSGTAVSKASSPKMALGVPAMAGKEALLPALTWHRTKDELLRTLQLIFRYQEFRGEWQQAAIQEVLAGRDVVVTNKTGDGKSLTYQLPVLVDALRVSRAALPSPPPQQQFKTTIVITVRWLLLSIPRPLRLALRACPRSLCSR